MVDNEDEAAGASGTRRGVGMLLVALAGVALIGLSWFDARSRIGETQEELARRLRDIEADSREARSMARQTQESTRELSGKLGALEAKLAESQSQQGALEALYQELSRSRDEWQLAEIEQVLAIAAQQLQLSGNVRAALLALQLAESRLARADRPQFLPVRRALARDIERLKALPALDLPGMSLKLEGVIASVDGLPFAHDERTGRAAAADERDAKSGAAGKSADPPKAAGGWLPRVGAELWSELRQLVTVRRMDSPEPPMVPPPQGYFIRENLKLRLLSARVSLLTRDEAGYREDLRVAQQWIRKYFDQRSKSALAALAQLKLLSAASINLELPSISASLEAVRSFKSPPERKRG